MKKTLYTLCAILALAACAKEQDIVDQEISGKAEESAVTSPAGRQITINATLSEELTKVSFIPDVDGNNKPILKLAWEGTDKLLVVNHDEPANDPQEFELTAGAGGKIGSFSGTLPAGATAFDVSVIHDNVDYAAQTQASDGSTDHLQYIASKANLKEEDFSAIEFDEISGVLGLKVKLPSAGASEIKTVTLSSSESLFAGGNTVTLTLTSAGVTSGDDILDVYVTLKPGDVTVPKDAILLVYFGMNDKSKEFVRFHNFTAETTLKSGKFNTLKFNCAELTHTANDCIVPGNGTSAYPYLIGDAPQVSIINYIAAGGQTTCLKMVADVDMTGVTHNRINTNSGYTQLVDFDGNNKTISNLTKELFYVFKGSITNLTLSGSTVSSRGILAEYCQGTGHSLTNVDITGGSLTCTSANSGAMIGRVNNGSETTITITDCDVTNTKVSGAAQTGGLIGSADAKVVINNCTVAKSGDGTSSVTASGANSGGLIGQTTGEVTITDCAVSGTAVSGTSVVGGVVGFANSLVTISGSKYTGGTITASGRYCGGFLGSTRDVASVISDCQVENATVNANYTDDSRGGGFVGQLQTSCQVKGCTVGTASAKVTVNTKQPKRTGSGTTEDPYVYSKINVGGFVGVNYGTITKDGDVRSKAYVKVTSANTYTGVPLDLGGFVGFGRGTIEYCDAVVDMTSLKGTYIGGFAGYVIQAGTKFDNCTVDGAVTGNNYTGGFAGYVDSGAPEISNCTASGTVSANSGCGGFVGQTMTGVFTDCSTSAACTFSGSNNGGFAGQIWGGSCTGCYATGNLTAANNALGGFFGLIQDSTTLDKCYATGNLSGSSSYYGGFGGSVNKGTVLVKRCYESGNVTCDQSYVSAFIANIYHASNTINLTIENCYSTGSIINSNQIRGGLIAQVNIVNGSATISNCYASGSVVGSFRLGGLIGNIGSANITVEHCAGWNSEVTASSHGSGNWSSGAIVGTAFPTCTLTDNYRKQDISLLSFWGNATGYQWKLEDDYQHPNVSSTAPLVICEITTGNLRATTAKSCAKGQDNYPQFAYNGKVEAGKTLSQLASTTLGWDSTIWDFDGPLPLLK